MSCDLFLRLGAGLAGPCSGGALETINIHAAVLQRSPEMIQQKLHGLISIPANPASMIPGARFAAGASAKLQASKEAIAIGGINSRSEANEPF